MAKYCILGSGYIASNLKKQLKHSWYPTDDTEYIFYLSGCTHMDFNKSPEYFYEKEKTALLNLTRFNAKIIYASSALVYEEPTKFGEFKKDMENIVLDHKGVVGRIFPVFGYENKTFIGQAIEKMSVGEKPIIFGNGSQTRSFVFIEDVLKGLIYLSKKESGRYDIGTDQMTSFNEIIYILNQILGTTITPEYNEILPANYKIKGVRCENQLLDTTPIEEALKLCVQSL